MTREQILKLFPNASEQFIRNNTGDKKARACKKPEKLKGDLPEEGRDKVRRCKPKDKGADEPDHPRFGVAITLRVSDRRVRDGDGAESTILDCIIAAVRRLKKMDN